MEKIIIFSGTSDGKRLAYQLADAGFAVVLSVATTYGEQVVAPHANVTIHTGRLDANQMSDFILSHQVTRIVDATHPYAQVVSAQLVSVCAQIGVEYIRMLRSANDLAEVVEVETTAQAAAYLAQTEGNVLLTTGSKELSLFTQVPDYQTRLFARVLSTAEVAQQCEALGFRGKNLIMMQGPFSQAMNRAMLEQIGAKWMVTKEGGAVGGFPEKIVAAQQAGVRVIVIRRPQETVQGFPFAQVVEKLTGQAPHKTVTLVGIGMGTPDTMTLGAKNAIANAELVIGSGRMLDMARVMGKSTVNTYRTSEMVQAIVDADAAEIAVALSGDIGFYSGATALQTALCALPNLTVRYISGISSVVYLCGQLGITWQDAHLISLHGRGGNLSAAVRTHKKVFCIVGGGTAVQTLVQTLCDCHLGHVLVHIGFDLSYPNEKILSDTAENLQNANLSGLCSVVIENAQAQDIVTHGLPDSAFVRGDAPMTKEEVRTVSLAKLRLTRDAIIYDVGAGTGSVSLEMAKVAQNGYVYAIERKEEACQLIENNQRYMGISNLAVVRGLAPDAMADLPAPTHVFIGGSAGNMKEIVQSIFAKNPTARIIINTVTLESVAEATELVNTMAVEDVDITAITIAKDRKVGRYHLMTGANPVYIYSFTGRAVEA